jgi:hypothetical protein
VSDPRRRCSSRTCLGDEDVERVRAGEAGVCFALHGQQADLGAVAMTDDEVMVGGERRERCRRPLYVMALDFRVGAFTAFQKRVSAKRDDDAHLSRPVP